MNQQRLQSYINLIQKLLACPSGQEWILLRQNEALVTPELVQVMEKVATQLMNQGNTKKATFLHNLAGQIYHLFMAQTPQTAKEEDKSEAYLELIKELLDCPEGSQGELLQQHQELLGPELVEMMQQVADQLGTSGNLEAAHYLQNWAREINRLWLQQYEFPSPSPKQPEPQSVASPPQPSTVPLAEDVEDFWAEPGQQKVEAPTTPPETLEPSPPPLTISEQLNRQLEIIAAALSRISDSLTRPASNPLWYMDVLEKAYLGNWILTSEEIQGLIGVKPSCAKGSDSFQRGCWVFVKAGKLGTQTGWQVKKAE